MTTSCPICGKPLVLKKITDVSVMNVTAGTPELRKRLGWFWVCLDCGKRWFRSAVLSKHTSQSLKKASINQQVMDWLERYGGMLFGLNKEKTSYYTGYPDLDKELGKAYDVQVTLESQKKDTSEVIETQNKLLKKGEERDKIKGELK